MQQQTGHEGFAMGRCVQAAATVTSIAEGLAMVAGALAELPAVSARCLPELERGRVAAILADGWNLAAFTPTGAAVLSVLDAGGASIEVIGGVPASWGQGRRGDATPTVPTSATLSVGNVETVEGRGAEGEGCEGEGCETEGGEGTAGRGDGGDTSLDRATSHGAVRAARGAPPGRRIAAMGLVPGPDGAMIRMSCGLVLQLPAAAITDPVAVAPMLAWHAAMHAAERRGLPAPPRLAAAIDELDVEFGIPPRPAGRVAWARELADRVAQELGLAPRSMALA
jgi:hypothetical protein